MLLALLPLLKNKIEKYKEKKDVEEKVGVLWLIVNFIVGLYALYLSFKRNNGIDLLSLLAALCCSWCYVIYALAVPVTVYTKINTRNNVNF
jgi:hypothetical protein